MRTFVRFALSTAQTTAESLENYELTNEMIAVMVILGGAVVLISFVITTVAVLIRKRKRAMSRNAASSKHIK